MDRMDPAVDFFNCSDRERAVFEAGIKLGSIYHQYTGMPVSESNVDVLERAIEEGTRVQPFVHDVSVKVDREDIRASRSKYKYTTLAGRMLRVILVIQYGTARARCRMEYVESLNYPLMYVEEIATVDQ